MGPEGLDYVMINFMFQLSWAVGTQIFAPTLFWMFL